MVVEEDVEGITTTVEKKVSKIEKASESITANAVQNVETMAQQLGQVGETIVGVSKYHSREYKFNVGVMLRGNPKVQDTAYAVLIIKPEGPITPPTQPPITPPEFPTEKAEIKLYKGWNLVSLPGKLVQFEVNGQTQKLLGFVYLKDEQKYVTIQEAQRILGSEFKEYLATNAFWVYSYSDYNLMVSIDKEVSFENIKLNSGWNLVPITDDMVGGYLGDIMGDCDFEKLYMWDSQGQSWKQIAEDYSFKSYEVKRGIIIKANDYCTMNGATIVKISPPDMPQ